MPAVTYLSDWEVKNRQSVPGDKDCDELLQKLRKLTDENWLIGIQKFPIRRTFREWITRAPHRVYAYHTLYADCHGEWQIINLVTPSGGSVFHGSGQSREDIMNFMLGYVAGLHEPRRKAAA